MTTEQIRVLVVDDNVSVSNNISRLLGFEADLKVIGESNTVQDCIDKIQELKPDVVLMDQNLPDGTGYQATEAILELDPFVQVIILGFGDSMPRRAIKAGAADFVITPFEAEQLTTAVRDAAARGKKRKAVTGPLAPPDDGSGTGKNGEPTGKVIVVYSGKGGVGCTTLATNLALNLHGEETPTVLVDGDFQYGDISLLLNQPTTVSICDLVSYADDLDEEVVGDVLRMHPSGLKLLASAPKPELAEVITPDAVRSVLSFLVTDFAYIVVDTSSTLDDLSLAIFDFSDLIVIVAVPELPSIKNTRFILDIFHDLGISRDRFCFVLNLANSTGDITRDMVQKNLKVEVGAEIPFDRDSVLASINRGQPLLLEGKTSAVARGLIDLVGAVKEALVERVEGA
jgi:pilus assembly protein CpaE